MIFILLLKFNMCKYSKIYYSLKIHIIDIIKSKNGQFCILTDEKVRTGM